MKVKVNWKELIAQLWAAVKPVLIGAIGGGIVAISSSGCSAMTPSSKSQGITAVGFGVPAIVWVASSEQSQDASGDDTNTAVK